MSRRFVWSGALAMLATLAAVGAAVALQTQAAPAMIKTASAQVLVYARGKTLYVYTRDTQNRSACTGGCATLWPPALVPGGVRVPATLPGATGIFGSLVRADGSRQLTYDGAPLYTYAGDRQPGAMDGQGVQGVWWAVAMGGRPSAVATSTLPGSYYGRGGDDHGRQGGHDGGVSATPTGSYQGGGRGDDRGRHGGHGGGSGAEATPTPSGGYYGGGDG